MKIVLLLAPVLLSPSFASAAMDHEFCASIRTISELTPAIEPWSYTPAEIRKHYKELNQNPILRELKTAFKNYYQHILVRAETDALEQLSEDYRYCDPNSGIIQDLTATSVDSLNISPEEKAELLKKIQDPARSPDENASRMTVGGGIAAGAGIGVIILAGGAFATGAPVIIGGILVIGGSFVVTGTGVKQMWRHGPSAYRETVLKNFNEARYQEISKQANQLALKAIANLIK